MLNLVAGHLQAHRSSKGSASSVQNVYFKMDVPRAHNVAVVVGTEWTQLEQKQPGTWQGEVRQSLKPELAEAPYIYNPSNNNNNNKQTIFYYCCDLPCNRYQCSH